MVYRLQMVDSPAPGDRRWLGGSSHRIAKREGHGQVGPTLCQRGLIISPLRRSQRKGETGRFSQDHLPNLPQPLLRASRGSQHAVGRALPHPESPRYSCYINNEGITERGKC